MEVRRVLVLGCESEPNLVRKPPRERDSGSRSVWCERTPISRLEDREGLANCSFQPEEVGALLRNAARTSN